MTLLSTMVSFKLSRKQASSHPASNDKYAKRNRALGYIGLGLLTIYNFGLFVTCAVIVSGVEYQVTPRYDRGRHAHQYERSPFYKV